MGDPLPELLYKYIQAINFLLTMQTSKVDRVTPLNSYLELVLVSVQ